MVIKKSHDLGHFGRKNAKGFYGYLEDGGKKFIWPELSVTAASSLPDAQPSAAEVKERLIYR